MDKTEPLSFISLVKSAINNEINIGQKDGILKMQLVINQLQLLKKLPQAVRNELLECILVKLKVNQQQQINNENIPEQKIDILDIFKVQNRQIMLLILTEIIQRNDFKLYKSFYDQEKINRLDKQTQISTISQNNLSQMHLKEGVNQFQITNQNVRDIMSICLKAVSHYFDGKKSFETLSIYLKLAFKVFVCVGVEGSQTILAGRTMAEFFIYFMLKSLNSKTSVMDKKIFSIFIELCIDSMKYLFHLIEEGERLLFSVKDDKIGQIIKNQLQHLDSFFIVIQWIKLPAF